MERDRPVLTFGTPLRIFLLMWIAPSSTFELRNYNQARLLFKFSCGSAYRSGTRVMQYGMYAWLVGGEVLLVIGLV